MTSLVPQKGIWTPFLLSVALFARSVLGQCPWPRQIAELHNSCMCAFNADMRISIQCSSVDFSLLMTVLHQRASKEPFDLIYINNSRIEVLHDRIFEGLTIYNLQLSSCGIYNISGHAFLGLEESLKNLNLQDNLLTKVPSDSLSDLQRLRLVDLSGNSLTAIPDGAFMGPPITTLKLADNPVVLHDNAFRGLEETLKNLNLKGTNLKDVPKALQGLHTLAFLDLAQNKIKSMEPGIFKNLDALTALNLERNLLEDIPPASFYGVNDTLSSLSLLNNLLTGFPSESFGILSQLRVLDIGFNLITKVPHDGFINMNSLTLLALDGNPLKTVPEESFTHLNTTLRGLSVGGRYLVCDCSVAWIPRWIEDFDLQVTSRERNPQFCGQPLQLREMSFYQMKPEDLRCNKSEQDFPIPLPLPKPIHEDEDEDPPAPPATLPPTTQTTIALESTPIPTEKTPTKRPKMTQRPKVTQYRPVNRPNNVSLNRAGSAVIESHPPKESNEIPRGGEGGGLGVVGMGGVESGVTRGPPPHRTHHRPSHSGVVHPSLVTHNLPTGQNTRKYFNNQATPAAGPYDVDEVIVQDAYRNDNSVIIQWDSEVTNILGFRVIYRLFGDKSFKLGPPLANSEREFRIRNVPTQECIVVCVVSLEDTNITPSNVPHSQCREVRTETFTSTHMDTIIIAASAAICGTVIIAVIVFICCNRKRGSGFEKDGIPAVLSSSVGPLASLGTLGGHKSDWDTLSMYSQKSIPRARMYHMDKGSVNNGYIPEDARSHISHISGKHIPRPRSLADGQSQRSYSGLSGRNIIAPMSYGIGMSLSRPDLRLSRQSLAPSQFSAAHFTPAALSRATSQRSERRRQRSRSRERSGSRMSNAGSSYSLTGYDTDGWTDHDVDTYTTRNATHAGLVQL